MIAIVNKTFKTATVGLFYLIRTTADVIPDDIDKACRVDVPADEKCIRTVIYKSKCSRVILLYDTRNVVVFYFASTLRMQFLPVVAVTDETVFFIGVTVVFHPK